MNKRLLRARPAKVDPGDLDLFVVTDSLREAVRVIEEARERHDDERLATPERSGEGTILGRPPRHGRPARRRPRQS
jgi:hypothetical protein